MIFGTRFQLCESVLDARTYIHICVCVCCVFDHVLGRGRGAWRRSEWRPGKRYEWREERTAIASRGEKRRKTSAVSMRRGWARLRAETRSLPPPPKPLASFSYQSRVRHLCTRTRTCSERHAPNKHTKKKSLPPCENAMRLRKNSVSAQCGIRIPLCLRTEGLPCTFARLWLHCASTCEGKCQRGREIPTWQTAHSIPPPQMPPPARKRARGRRQRRK